MYIILESSTVAGYLLQAKRIGRRAEGEGIHKYIYLKNLPDYSGDSDTHPCFPITLSLDSGNSSTAQRVSPHGNKFWPCR